MKILIKLANASKSLFQFVALLLSLFIVMSSYANWLIFVIWKTCATVLQCEQGAITHKNWVGLTSVHICKYYFHMNKGCGMKFIPGRGKRAEITRNVIQIGNLYSSERFSGFIMFHGSLWWVLFLFKQTNPPLKHWLFAHEWKWQGTGTHAKDCSPLGPEGIAILCPCLQVGIQGKDYPKSLEDLPSSP